MGLQVGKIESGDRMRGIAIKPISYQLRRLDVLTDPVHESADFQYMCAFHFHALHFCCLRNYYLHANYLLNQIITNAEKMSSC